MQELLFDDVVWVQQARRDHFDFVAKMVDRGVEVLELQDLLTDVVAMPDGLEWLLDRKVTDNQVGPALALEIRAWLSELSSDRLAEFLIEESPTRTYRPTSSAVSSLRSANWTPQGSYCDLCPIPSSCATTRHGSLAGSP